MKWKNGVTIGPTSPASRKPEYNYINVHASNFHWSFYRWHHHQYFPLAKERLYKQAIWYVCWHIGSCIHLRVYQRKAERKVGLLKNFLFN